MEGLTLQARKNERPTGRSVLEPPGPPPYPSLAGGGKGGVGSEAGWGGKALALSRLRQSGLPVPAGFVVPAGVYRRALRDEVVRRALETLGATLDGERSPTPQSLAR